ncbi:MAG: hypothetical protein GYA41_03835 [Bacteroidales bacterium]|nr:hypothetical protein [Bacteroidales bacterium]
MMKYCLRNLLALLIALHTVVLFAQKKESGLERGSIHPGYVITLKGDTVKGYLLNINLWLNQKMTFFYSDPQDRKGRIKYTPKEIKAYQVGQRYYESIKYPFVYSTHAENFILRKVNGPIKYYVWYYDEDRNKLMSLDKLSLTDLEKAILFDESELWTNEFGLKQNEETLTPFNLKFLMKFSRNMADYVKDYPELARKIESKHEGYKNINIESIIREYNEWYIKNH